MPGRKLSLGKAPGTKMERNEQKQLKWDKNSFAI